MFFGVIADAYFDTKTHFLFPLIIHESTLSCNFIGFFMTIFMAMAISVIHEREAPAIANPQIRNGWGFSFIITEPAVLPPDSFSRTAHSRPRGLPLGNSRCAKIETNAIPRLRPAMHPLRSYRSTGRTGRVLRRRGN